MTIRGVLPKDIRAIQDILNPTARRIMDQMFREANPIFRWLQAQGYFDRGRSPRQARPRVDPWLSQEE